MEETSLDAGAVSYTHLDVYKRQVAAFEPTLDGFAEAVARTGGQIQVDVVKAKPRPNKEPN